MVVDAFPPPCINKSLARNWSCVKFLHENIYSSRLSVECKAKPYTLTRYFGYEIYHSPKYTVSIFMILLLATVIHKKEEETWNKNKQVNKNKKKTKKVTPVRYICTVS